MRAKFALTLLSLCATGCGASAPLVTVDKLLAQCDSFKGKPVQLAGYLGECAGYDCHVAADESHWRAFVSAFNAAHGEQGPVQRAAWSRALAVRLVGVGGGKAFDRKAAPFQHSYVVINGAIATDSCTGEGETDRGRGIEPIDIRAWTKSEGAPANTR